MEVTVTPDMTARLFGREVHPVYGTAWMVRHVEESGRLVLERYLDADEDATGYSIELTHERPGRVGEHLTVRARVVAVGPRECVTEHEVSGPAGLIGRARFVQRYIQRGALSA
jgi:predicted thioesterase